MQQTLPSQSCCRRRHVCFGTLLTIACLIVVLVLMTKFVILPQDSKDDSNGIMNNATTEGNILNEATTSTSTMNLSTQMIYIPEDARIHMSTRFPSQQWIIDSHLTIEQLWFSAARMKNSDILGCGTRITDLTWSPSCELYSSQNRKWRTATVMNVHRHEHTLTLLSNGRKILAVGSIDSIDGHTAEIYDIEIGKWIFVSGILNPIRSQHTATLLKNGQVLIAGGSLRYFNIIHSSVLLYIPSSNTFNTTGNLNIARNRHTAILLNDGMSVLVIGGSDYNQARPEIYINGSWFYTAGDMIYRRIGCAAVLLPNGNVLVAGGIDSNNIVLSSVEIYNVATDTFSLVQSMACARSHFTLTLLPSGEVLAVGGKGSAIDRCLRVSELYDPISDQWRNSRVLNTFRYDHIAIFINNSVLIMNGFIHSEFERIRICERYDL